CLAVRARLALRLSHLCGGLAIAATFYLSLHYALPIFTVAFWRGTRWLTTGRANPTVSATRDATNTPAGTWRRHPGRGVGGVSGRSDHHPSALHSLTTFPCRLLLARKFSSCCPAPSDRC